MLSGGARESRDNVSGRSNNLKKDVMGWGSTNRVRSGIGTFPVVLSQRTRNSCLPVHASSVAQCSSCPM